MKNPSAPLTSRLPAPPWIKPLGVGVPGAEVASVEDEHPRGIAGNQRPGGIREERLGAAGPAGQARRPRSPTTVAAPVRASASTKFQARLGVGEAPGRTAVRGETSVPCRRWTFSVDAALEQDRLLRHDQTGLVR